MKKHDKDSKSKKQATSFEGKIRYVSVSPHGDPEAIVLEDGTFIKMPPHSLLEKDLVKVGKTVSGKGEMIIEEPNRMFHHAQVMIGHELVSDDSMDKDAKEELKEKHKADLKNRDDAPAKKTSLRGKAVAFGLKPKGEIDRIIFDDGTSVHVPKDVEIDSDDFQIGDEIEVKGEARTYGSLRFVKAESVQRAN